MTDTDSPTTTDKPAAGAPTAGVKAGRIPIHIGGHSEAAARRAGRVGDGLFLAGGDMAHLLDVARNTAADCGRDPESLEMSAVHLGLFGDDPSAAVQEAESWVGGAG